MPGPARRRGSPEVERFRKEEREDTTDLQSGHNTGPGQPVSDLRMRCRAFRHSDERGALDCGKLVVITRSEEVQC